LRNGKVTADEELPGILRSLNVNKYVPRNQAIKAIMI